MPQTTRTARPARPARPARRLARLLACERGTTLIELLIALSLMAIVLGPLTSSLVTGLTSQAVQTNIVQAQENARESLERMRKDIHCAHSVAQPITNTSGGQTLILNETNVAGTADCPGLLSANATTVQWCTVPVAGATDRYELYRENDLSQGCDGSSGTFEVDYLTRSDLWTLPTCTTGEYATVSVTMPLKVTEQHAYSGTYTLNDSIALRNASICA